MRKSSHVASQAWTSSRPSTRSENSSPPKRPAGGPPLSAARARRGLRGQAGLPGRVSLYPGGAAHHVPGPLLDHAPVCGVRLGRRNPTSATAIFWNRARPAFRWPFDLPTQIGYDSDHELARGEVGKVGVSISSLADMEMLLDQIPLDKVSTSMTINAPASACCWPCTSRWVKSRG
jgi:hypothetical protein